MCPSLQDVLATRLAASVETIAVGPFMKRAFVYAGSLTLILSSIVFGNPSQQRQATYSLPADQIIPGRPWTSIIPDPDKFDWTSREGGRPGYRYRGMLPAQQRFYEYIQEKRRNNQELTWAERSTIRWLISSRRWPEAPRPNAFWSAFMRYLREQPTADLNVAQGIMMNELISRGLVPVDMPPSANFERVREYLNSGPFHSRNWFERVFGRIEPWMDNLYAGYGFDMRPSAPLANAFPPKDTFNGLRVIYDVSGATLSETVDSEGFTIQRRIKGVLGTGTLTISGTARVGGFGADVSLSVWAGDQKNEKTFYIENRGNDGNPQNFSLSVPIPAGARTGGFAIHLDGRYSMGGGHRGCYVTGDFGPSRAQLEAERAAADAKWRQEVEDTLQRLGYENTPEGRETEEMRKALAGGDAAWNTFVNRRLEQMRGDTSPEIAEFNELENAMTTGGSLWDEYVASHRTANAAAASSFLKQAQSLSENGKYKDAIDAYSKAIESNGNSAEAYAGRALAKRGLQDVDGASVDIARALELDPNNAEAHRVRSMVKRSRNDHAGALADATRAVELAPNNFRTYLTRGVARENLKDLNGALADYNRSIEINPDYAMSYLYRGTVRLNLKDNRGALTDLNRFIGSVADNSAGYNNRGLAKERLGDLNGAVADYQKSVELNPQSENVRRNLARVRESLGLKNDSSAEITVFSNMNVYAVGNRPTVATSFTIEQSHVITSILTYHWNDGRGTQTGTIALRDSAGRVYGPWPAEGSPGQGGVPNANWTSKPNVTLPPGTYSIIDSEPSTWSQNSGSGGCGMSIVKGYRTTSTDRP